MFNSRGGPGPPGSAAPAHVRPNADIQIEKNKKNEIELEKNPLNFL